MSANVPETLVRHASVKRDGLKIRVMASAAYYLLRVSVDSEVVFSAGSPNSILPIDLAAPELALDGLDIYVASDLEYADERKGAADWLAVEAHRALLSGLRLSSGEAVHVGKNAVSVVLNASRELDEPLVDTVTSLARALGSAPRRSRASDVDQLPEPLRNIVVRYLSLAEGDDVTRGEILARMSKAKRREFLAAMDPLFPAINDYLGTLQPPWPEAASLLSNLAELASEIGSSRHEPFRRMERPQRVRRVPGRVRRASPPFIRSRSCRRHFMARRLSKAEKMEAAKNLGDWCLTVVRFYKEDLDRPIPGLSAMFEKVIETNVADGNLRGLEMLARDYAEMGRSGTAAQEARLDELLKKRYGRGLRERLGNDSSSHRPRPGPRTDRE